MPEATVREATSAIVLVEDCVRVLTNLLSFFSLSLSGCLDAQLFEEHELIWDDRVAAEMCLDFDASFVPTSEVGCKAEPRHPLPLTLRLLTGF